MLSFSGEVVRKKQFWFGPSAARCTVFLAGFVPISSLFALFISKVPAEILGVLSGPPGEGTLQNLRGRPSTIGDARSAKQEELFCFEALFRTGKVSPKVNGGADSGVERPEGTPVRYQLLTKFHSARDSQRMLYSAERSGDGVSRRLVSLFDARSILEAVSLVPSSVRFGIDQYSPKFLGSSLFGSAPIVSGSFYAEAKTDQISLVIEGEEESGIAYKLLAAFDDSLTEIGLFDDLAKSVSALKSR